MLKTVLIAGACLVLLTIHPFMKKKFSDKLVLLIARGRFEEFDRLADTKRAKYLISPFNLTALRLNRMIAEDQLDDVNTFMRDVNFEKMKEEQKTYLAYRAFRYCVEKDDYHNAGVYKKLLDTSENESLRQKTDWIYDIVIKKGSSYLNDILENTSETFEDEVEKNLLLSLLYKNIGDEDKCQEYNQKACLMLNEANA